ncbi:MAG: hypothetical protein ABIG44_11740 [Planctomycetota bacterium]
MPDTDLMDVRVRDVSAADLDAIRPLARGCGYRHTIADLIRFAVALAANLGRRTNQQGMYLRNDLAIPWPTKPRNRGKKRPRPLDTPADTSDFQFP